MKELEINGASLKRYGVGRPGWHCTKHGRMPLTTLWKEGREYQVCWQCVHQELEIGEAIYDPRKRRSEADELADRERDLQSMD